MPEQRADRPLRPWSPLSDDRFSPEEATRLVRLRERHDRGEFREVTPTDRLRFARWLVAHGWFDDWGPTRQSSS
jgi:hypothetical protein